jgi:hypothetical protein
MRGMDDKALLPVSWASLPDYCDHLAIRKLASADHCLVHQPDEVDAADRRLFALLKRRARPAHVHDAPRPLQWALKPGG